MDVFDRPTPRRWRKRRWKLLAAAWLLLPCYLLSAGPAMYVLDVGWVPVSPNARRTVWQTAYGPSDRVLSASPLKRVWWDYLGWWEQRVALTLMGR